jgi:hypothetical protein
MKKTTKITGILVDVKAGVARKATIEKSLDGYYKALNCDCIDVVTRRIGGQRFDIICDDEALLKAFIKPSAVDKDNHPMLFGNLFVVNFNGKDDVCSLREGQIEHVLRHTKSVTDLKKRWMILTDCDY